MRSRLFIAIAFSLFCAFTAMAQSGPDNDPDVAPGFVNSVFHHGQVDSINLYNGQLTIPIPLGPTYPVGPSLKFQAVLTYNARTTDYGQPYHQVDRFVFTPFVGNPALGQGWEFTLGAIRFCKQGNTAGSCYFGPDGSQHLFSQGSKTADGSQLSLSGTGPYDMWDGDGNHYVFGWQVAGLDDSPIVAPGYVHDFGMSRDGWYLTSVTDPFGNSYSVSYYTVVPPCWRYGSISGETPCSVTPVMNCPSSPVQTWIPQAISLPTGTVRVLLRTQGTTANMIGDFLFPVVGGADSVWSLGYEQFWDDFHNCSDFFTKMPIEVQRLTSIQLPPDIGGSPSYGFNYACPLTMTLPSGATISYTFGEYSFYHGRAGATQPSCGGMRPPNVPYVDVSFAGGGCPFSSRNFDDPNPPNTAGTSTCTLDNDARWVDRAPGVVRRTETIPGAGGSPAIVATTDYTQYSFPFGEQGSTASKLDAQTLTVVLFPPDADNRRRAKAVLFRSTPKGAGPSVNLYAQPGDRVGADLEERIFDGDPNNTSTGIGTGTAACGAGSDQPFCSSRAVRVVRRGYEYDDCNADGLPGGTICHEVGNRRLKTQTTCHGPASPAGACASGLFHTVTFKNLAGRDWDAANGRHYNTEEHSGTLGNDIRAVTTYWTPSVLPWLPNLFNRRTDTLGGATLDRYFEFTPSNGFFRGEAIYDAGRQTVFLTCRYNDGAGNVGQDFSATYPGQTSAPPANVCSLAYPTYPTVAIGVNGDAFGKAYTHRNGLLLSARWMQDPATQGFSVKNLFRDFTTGWILASSDSSGVTTGYSYDSLGRVTSISPQGEAATVVNYDSATQTTATRDGGPGLATLQQYLYDGLGRVGREVRQLPSSSDSPYALRLTRYDGVGHTAFVSEWAGCADLAGCADASPLSGTTTSNFDPTGRPQTVRGADGATTTTSFADGGALFSDTFESVTVNNINGSCAAGCAGGVSATTGYRYDAFRRLTSVTEPGGDTTSYLYDVNGKLTRVTQGVQTRTFSYDAAGFLRSETTPEKGTVSYDSYGSLGNLLAETEPGGLAVTRSYDFAGRLTGTIAGGQRYVTNCYDGLACVDGNPGYFGGSRPIGKLTRRVGFNPLAPSAPIVTDDFDYTDSAGRLSSQLTTSTGPVPLSTKQRWQYNGLGLVAHHYHPRPSGSGAFAVSTDYDAGLPATEYVNGIPMVTGVRYQPSGSLGSYSTGIGIGHDVTTEILVNTASLLPRPARISATAQGSASPAFDTFGYAYDGVGNITAMGPDTFSYDTRSRLMSANLSGAGSQSYTYDRYGNLLTKAGNTFCSGSCANNQVAGASYVRGNLTSFAGQSFAYDSLDRMASSQSSGLTWSYLYDGADERLGKIPPSGAWTRTLRDGGNRVVSEFSGTTASRDNVFLGNQLVLSSADTSIGGNGPAWTFYSSDHLGTPRLVTDLAGVTVETRRYWPFGDALPTQSPFGALRFATMEFDAEGGTAGGLASDRYYDHARSHVGGLARFLGPDKATGSAESPQSWNRYSYGLNNPLRVIDPDGKAPTGFQEAAASMQPLVEAASMAADVLSGAPGGLGEIASQASGLISLTASTLDAASQTGEAIGSGADAFTVTNAICNDAQTLLGAFVALAGGARSLGVGGPGIKLFRLWGDEGPGFAPGRRGSGPYGKPWTTVDPSSVANFRDAAGLPAQNTGRFVSEGRLVNSKGVVRKKAIPLAGNKGGATEYVVPDPEKQIKLTRVSGVNPPY